MSCSNVRSISQSLCHKHNITLKPFISSGVVHSCHCGSCPPSDHADLKRSSSLSQMVMASAVDGVAAMTQRQPVGAGVPA